MPATTITINREQRDGLYELARNHLGSAGDLFDALEREKDFGKAEQLGHGRHRTAARLDKGGGSKTGTFGFCIQYRTGTLGR